MKFLRERFKSRIPYHEAYISQGIKLDANENSHPFPQELKEHMKKWAEEMNIARYPDTDSLKLAEALAACYNVNPENITCGVGSDELIDCILRSTIEVGELVLAPNPSFSMYPQFTELNAGKLIQIPLKKDFSYDVPALIRSVKEFQPKVILLCNPNNPTGSLLSLIEIKEIIAAAKGLVVVDEAYGEFCEVTAIPLIKEYDNLIVLKTFSKAYSLAGARVGYGIADKELIDMINIVKAPYNLNIFSQEAATWAISHKALFEPIIRSIVEQRTYLIESFKKLELTVYPSYTNFLWIEMPEEAAKALENAQIYIRKMKYEGKQYYRITVGTKEENKALLKVLAEALKA